MTYLGKVECNPGPSSPKKGVTIGNQGCDYNGGDEKPFQQAVAEGHRFLEVKGGSTFRFTAPWTNNVDDLCISASPFVTFVPSNDASFGLFNFGGDRVQLHHVHVDIQTPVAGQTVVQLQGNETKVFGGRYWQSGVGNATNSTHLLSFGDVSNVIRTKGGMAHGVTFIPNIGSVCLQRLFQDGGITQGNYFGPGTVATQIGCRAALSTQSCRGQVIVGNRFEYLGTVAQGMDALWRERPAGLAGVDGGNSFVGNTIRSCHFLTMGIFFNGATGWTIAGNSIENITELGGYFWQVEGTTGGSTGIECSGITFGANTFSSVGKAGVGGAINFAWANRSSVIGASFLGCINAQIGLVSSNKGAGATSDPASSMYALRFAQITAIGDGVVPRVVPNGAYNCNGWTAHGNSALNFLGAAGTRFWNAAILTNAFNSADLYDS